MECRWCLSDTVEKTGEWRRIGLKIRSYYHCHTCNIKWNTQNGISKGKGRILPVGGFTFASGYFPWDTETWEFDINEEERWN